MRQDTSAGDGPGDAAPDADTGFDLRNPPAGFHDDPYSWYERLRATEPVKVLADGSVFLTRYDDVAAMYRNPAASSDKKAEFRPKYGDTPLYEHHTSSLVFNDAPAHPRVRKPMLGAVNQRAIARIGNRRQDPGQFGLQRTAAVQHRVEYARSRGANRRARVAGDHAVCGSGRALR